MTCVSTTDAGMGSDSFWPSFTDIMMVVVMIFMIASTVLMLRNWELVQKLRATIEAEHAARRWRVLQARPVPPWRSNWHRRNTPTPKCVCS